MKEEYERFSILTGCKNDGSNETKDLKQSNLIVLEVIIIKSNIFLNVGNTLLENTDRFDGCSWT